MNSSNSKKDRMLEVLDVIIEDCETDAKAFADIVRVFVITHANTEAKIQALAKMIKELVEQSNDQ